MEFMSGKEVVRLIGGMKMQESDCLIKDIVEWDIANWSRSIKFWEGNVDVKNKKALVIGDRYGGLSLYFALKGADVTYSDLDEVCAEKAKELHKRYGQDNIIYRKLNVLELEEENQYDIIAFKSVMGGVGYNGNYHNQEKMVENIYRALNEDGVLFFAENLKGSSLHRLGRRMFRKWADKWRYVTVDEIKSLLSNYKNIKYNTFGFLGIFGRTNLLNKILGCVDIKFDKYISENHRYIISVIAEK